MPIQNIKKFDDNTISLERVYPQVVNLETHNYDQLLHQRDALQAQKDLQDKQLQEQIDAINDLLARADALGVVAAKS